MALVLDVVTHKNADGVTSKDIVVLRDTVTGKNTMVAVVTDALGALIDATHPLSVKIEADAAGSAVVTDDESVPRANAQAALAVALLYGANGLTPATTDRLIAYIFSGAQAVSEAAAKGAATSVVVTVNSATANGTQLISANSAGTRRRVVITQRGTTAVEVKPGNITAATGQARHLPGVAGAEQTWFIAGELRATCASGTQDVSVTEEVLG